jgi:hypothetical protein
MAKEIHVFVRRSDLMMHAFQEEDDQPFGILMTKGHTYKAAFHGGFPGWHSENTST